MADKPFILFKFATRSRPEKFKAGLANIIGHLADKENYAIWVTADEDDPTMYNPELLRSIAHYIESSNVRIDYGTSKNKIDAINRGMKEATEAYNWQILVNFSDDMQFKQAGFDDIIRQDFQKHYGSWDGNLFYNDGFVGDKISTMSIIGRAYYERFGYIYHPSYKSLFCDNEYTEVAQMLNRIQYVDKILYNHNHPANVGGEVDALLRKTESFWKEDEANYNERRKNRFYVHAK